MSEHEQDSEAEAERRRRAEAVNFAIASVEIEGFEVPEWAKAAFQRFVDGEISLEELMDFDPRSLN